MQLGEVIGTVVATTRAVGLDGVRFLVVQPLDRAGRPRGRAVVAGDGVAMAGPGELVYIVASREAALAMPDTFVPVDHAVVGIIDQLAVDGDKDSSSLFYNIHLDQALATDLIPGADFIVPFIELNGTTWVDSGDGKSTTAMHVIVALLKGGFRVGSIDLDARQGTLSRMLENRAAYGAAVGRALVPEGDQARQCARASAVWRSARTG